MRYSSARVIIYKIKMFLAGVQHDAGWYLTDETGTAVRSNRLSVFTGRPAARTVPASRPSCPPWQPLPGATLLPQLEGACNGATEPDPGRLGRRRLRGRVWAGDEDETTAALVVARTSAGGTVIVVDGWCLDGRLRRRRAGVVLLTVVDGDTVRYALSDTEAVTTALQPLTTVRPCITQPRICSILSV